MSKQTIIICNDGISAVSKNPYNPYIANITYKDIDSNYLDFEANNPPYPTIGEFEPGMECSGELVWHWQRPGLKSWQIETPKQAEPTIKEVHQLNVTSVPKKEFHPREDAFSPTIKENLTIEDICKGEHSYILVTENTEYPHLRCMVCGCRKDSAELERKRIVGIIEGKLKYLNSCGAKSKNAENLIFAKTDILSDILNSINKGI